MKKLILFLGLGIATTVAFSSCAKESCYECSLSVAGVATTQDICDGKITSTAGGLSTTTDLPSGQSAEDYKSSLETAGYTCSQK
jgi:hypothetical protein